MKHFKPKPGDLILIKPKSRLTRAIRPYNRYLVIEIISKSLAGLKNKILLYELYNIDENAFTIARKDTVDSRICYLYKGR